MNNIVEKMNRGRLEKEYQNVIGKIRGGKIMGISINEYDIHALVVGAYYAGKYEFDTPSVVKNLLRIEDE